jgi:6-phosphogluconolactonase
MMFFIGTYSSDAGKGIYPLAYRAADDTWTLGEPDASIENVSYAAYNPYADLYYLLNEQGGEVSSFTWSPAAGWQRVQTSPSFGAEPCFVSIDPKGQWLAIANYGSGHVVRRALEDGTGDFSRPIIIHDHYGKGPNAERQDGPHAHCVQFRGDWLYSTDLGTDSILVRRVDLSGGEDAARVAFQAPPGEGPRHILFHPEKPVGYLLSELGSKVFVLREGSDGRLEEMARVSTLPDGFQGESLGGHLTLNDAADRLYVSNRGHDSLSVFAIADDGALTLLQNVGSGGQSPRFFLLVETIGRVLIAHQNGNSVVGLELKADGTVGGVKATLPVAQAAFIGRLIAPEKDGAA